MIEELDFDDWNELKKTTHNSSKSPAIKDREIWWCAMGKNIGVEINGKNQAFSRPVLIFKKLSRYGFMGIPLTSQEHEGSWYASFVFRDRRQNAVLAQARVMSVSRLYKRIGMIPESDFDIIKAGFRKLYLESE